MLSSAELFNIAKFIHEFNDEGVELHNSRCSYVWKSIKTNTQYNSSDESSDDSTNEAVPIGQEWIVYFMNTTIVGSKVRLQFAKLGSDYIYSNTAKMVDMAKFNQYREFEAFVSSE